MIGELDFSLSADENQKFSSKVLFAPDVSVGYLNIPTNSLSDTVDRSLPEKATRSIISVRKLLYCVAVASSQAATVEELNAIIS